MSERQRDANLGIDPDLERRDPLAYEKRVREIREKLEQGLIDDGKPATANTHQGPQRIIGYKPKAESDLCIQVQEDNENMSYILAQGLYQAYARDCTAHHVKRTVFKPNLTYEFSSGLVFRLLDEFLDGEKRNVVLEFYVPPERAAEKRAILLSIPSLLRQAGVKDETALRQLQNFIPNEAVSLDTAKITISAQAGRG